jgi:hypothetical protein
MLGMPSLMSELTCWLFIYSMSTATVVDTLVLVTTVGQLSSIWSGGRVRC